MLATCASVQRHNAVGKPLPPITAARFGKGAFRNLPLDISSCRTFCMSKTSGQHILFGSGSDIYLSNNFGRSFYLSKVGVLPAGTAAYSSLISDDGQVVLLYGSGLGIAAHSFYLTTNAFASATDGTLLTASSTATTTASTFTLTSACLSHADGQFIFLSGSGSSGGVFVSTDRGNSFVQELAATTAHSCDCSPSGRLVVVSLNGGTPYYSSDFGMTFSSIGTTAYNGRRVYVHPDESYFAIRCTSSFVYVNLSEANTTLLTSASAYFKLAEVTSSTVITNTQAEDDATAVLDRNGRLYYVSSASSKISYANAALSTQTEESAFSSMTFSDRRIAATTDGKFLLVYTGSTLRFLKQFHYTNAVTFLNAPVIASTGDLSFTLQSADASYPLALYWTPRTGLAQPKTYAAGTTSVTLLSSEGGFLGSQTYTFTVATLSETGGLINGRESLVATNNKPQVTATGGQGDIYTNKERYIFRVSGTIRVNVETTVNVLLVGGGGGGGGAPITGLGDGGGGGGAGEYAYGSLTLAANQEYSITVGSGGLGVSNTTNSTSTISRSQAGSSTTITDSSTGVIVASALGGGGGGHVTNTSGSTGGSSGGACGFATLNASVNATTSTTPAGWTRRATKGGNGQNQRGGGGGGGSGGAGVTPTDANAGGSGGTGSLATTYYDSTTYFAAGGSGGFKLSTSGTTFKNPADGADATDNTGNGGNGGSMSNSSASTKGGRGGSGIAIILFP